MPQLKHFPLPDVGEGLTEAEILGWKVAPGDAVAGGQPLVVMEAMKMENELRAPSAGTVKRVAVTPGTAVEKGALLVELE